MAIEFHVYVFAPVSVIDDILYCFDIRFDISNFIPCIFSLTLIHN